jgi:hypothetical protein
VNFCDSSYVCDSSYGDLEVEIEDDEFNLA